MSVPVVGYDVGSLTSFVGVAKGGGVEIITNEYSERSSPTCVAFAGRRRLVGTAAKLQHATNVSNTIVDFLPLIGKNISDPSLINLIRSTPNTISEGPDGRALLQITYCGQVYRFLPEQVLAMQLTKLKELTESSLGSKVVDVVLNVPGYYTDRERRAMLDGCRIAGINCVRLVNDLTAVATAYGLYNKDLPANDQPPRNVAFVSVGYSSSQVSICSFNSSKVKVLAFVWDTGVGGRFFDRVLYDKFSKEFEEKYGLKITESPKATIRLLQECEKVKKLMSANSQEIPINVECVMNDRDLCSRIKRADYETLCDDLLVRFENLLKNSLEMANIKPADLYSVELVGGSSRVPAIKAIVSKVFCKEARTTLNADEAVSRGCVLQAAMCSPGSRVREFVISEACPYSITLHWDKEENADQTALIPVEDGGVAVSDKETSMEIFPLFHPVPSSRRVFFSRRGALNLEARYTSVEKLPNSNAVIGTFRVHGASLKPSEVNRVRIKARVNPHGIFSVSQAEVAEEYEKEVEVEVPITVPESEVKENHETAAVNSNVESSGNGDTASVTSAAASGESKPLETKPKTPTTKKEIVKKKATRYKDLLVDESIVQFSTKQLNEFCETEGKLYEEDQLESKRSHAKNAVEEYVYDMRSKLQGALNNFSTSEEQCSFNALLTETEDWLYGDGEDLHRQAYIDRLKSIKQPGDKIEFRFYEHQNRGPVVDRFEHSIVHVRNVLDSVTAGQEMYNHLTPDHLNKLTASMEKHEGWLREKMHLQSLKKLFEDPAVKSDDIFAQLKAFDEECRPILSTPKPAPPPPAPTEPATNNSDTKGDGNGVPDPVNGIPMDANKQGKAANATSHNNSESMDVD